MNDWKDELPSDGWLAKKTLIYTGIFAACVILFMLLILSVKPAFLGFERAAFKESHQYVESKETQLLQLVTEYHDLDVEIAKYQADNDAGQYDVVIAGQRAQRDALETRIKTEAQRVPKGALPESVETFINNH